MSNKKVVCSECNRVCKESEVLFDGKKKVYICYGCADEIYMDGMVAY